MGSGLFFFVRKDNTIGSDSCEGCCCRHRAGLSYRHRRVSRPRRSGRSAGGELSPRLAAGVPAFFVALASGLVPGRAGRVTGTSRPVAATHAVSLMLLVVAAALTAVLWAPAGVEAAQVVDAAGDAIGVVSVQCSDGVQWRLLAPEEEAVAGEACYVSIVAGEPILVGVSENGVIRLPELRTVPLVVLDEGTGTPIEAGTMAWSENGAQEDPVVVDWQAEGGRLDVRPHTATTVSIQAEGYRAAEVRLDQELSRRRTVLLRPVAGLTVTLDPPVKGELKLANEDEISPYKTFQSICETHEIEDGKLTLEELRADVIHIGAVLTSGYEPILLHVDTLPFKLEASLEQGMSAEGIVHDSAGEPIPKAEVSIEGLVQALDDLTYEQQATTNAEGRFLMTGLIPGLARIKACAKGFTCVTEEFEIVEGETVGPFSFMLEPGFDLELTIVNSAGRPPLPIYVATESWRKQADDHGRVVIPGVKKGEKLELEIFGRHFVQIKPTIVVDGPKQQIVVEEGGWLHWPIILNEDIAGLEMWCRWRQYDENGLHAGSGWCRLAEDEENTIVASGLRPGTFQVELRLEGYAPLFSDKGELVEDGALWLPALAPEAGSLVLGRVLDNETYEPVVGARVSCELGSPSAYRPPKETDPIASCESDADGVFRLRGLDERACRIRVTAPGFAETLLDGIGPTAEGTDLGDIELGRGMTIRGVVTDRVGDPQPNVRVALWEDALYAYEPQNATVSNADGVYKMELVPPGSWQVRATRSGRRAQVDVVGVEGDVVEADLLLGGTRVEGMVYVGDEPGGSGVMIFSPPGNEERGWVVYRRRDFDDLYIFGLPKQPVRGMVFDDGTFVLENVDPGSYLAYYTPDAGSYGASVDIVVPEVPIHSCVLNYPNGIIRGLAVDDDDTPVEGVRIDVLDYGREVATFSDASGAFEISGFADGMVKLGAKRTGYGPPDPLMVEIRDGRPTEAVVIRMKSQEGGSVSLQMQSHSGSVASAPAVLVGTAEQVAFSDPNGLVSWKGVRSGLYRACGRAYGGPLGCTEPFQLDDDDSLDERLVLDVGSEVMIILPEVDGEVSQEPRVRVLMADGTDISNIVFLGNPLRRSGGAAMLGPLGLGSYLVQISWAGRAWQEPVTVSGSQPIELDLRD